MAVEPKQSSPCISRRVAALRFASSALLLPGLRVSAAEDADTVRIREGYTILTDLVKNWDKYAGTKDAPGGDNVRRQAGYVGKNALTQINKARQLPSVPCEAVTRILVNRKKLFLLCVDSRRPGHDS
jgi:hypothetical protein